MSEEEIGVDIGFSLCMVVTISVKTGNISIFQSEMCWTMKVANYEQMKEKNEKMKQDWQEGGGKIKERLTVCEQYNKKGNISIRNL